MQFWESKAVGWRLSGKFGTENCRRNFQRNKERRESVKNNKKGGSAKIEIELLLQKALRVQQEPSQQLNDSIIRQCEKRIEQGSGSDSGWRKDCHGFFDNCFSNFTSKKYPAQPASFIFLQFLTGKSIEESLRNCDEITHDNYLSQVISSQFLKLNHYRLKPVGSVCC